MLLPPAIKLRQGNVFTPVCNSVHGGGSLSHDQGGLRLGGLCPGGSLSGRPPRQSPLGTVMSGQYASYWNAFLLTRMHSSRICTAHCSGCLMRGVCLGGVCLGGCTPPPPWTKFLTHACENITLTQLCLRTVISKAVNRFVYREVRLTTGFDQIATCC